MAGLLGVEHQNLIRSEEDGRTDEPGLYGNVIGQRLSDIYVAEGEAEALAALILAHSVFNVEFPKKTRNILYYFQKYVIGIDDGTKTPQKVLTFLSKH